MIIACIYAGLFLMEPNVFLKYDSVNSKCTPVMRNGAGLINSVLWMRKLTMSSADGKILQCITFNTLSYCPEKARVGLN